MADHLADLLSFFEFKKGIGKQLNPIKRRGYAMSKVFSVLMLLPFLKHASVHALLKSGNKELAEGGKDVYYRFRNRDDIAWRKLQTSFVKRFLFIITRKAEAAGEGVKRCLVTDVPCCLKRVKQLSLQAGFGIM